MNSTGKVVFTQDEMNKAGNLFYDSEKHGFIVRVKDDSNGVIYHFRHLTLQEFFVALEFFRRGADSSEIIISLGNLKSFPSLQDFLEDAM